MTAKVVDLDGGTVEYSPSPPDDEEVIDESIAFYQDLIKISTPLERSIMQAAVRVLRKAKTSKDPAGFIRQRIDRLEAEASELEDVLKALLTGNTGGWDWEAID